MSSEEASSLNQITRDAYIQPGCCTIKLHDHARARRAETRRRMAAASQTAADAKTAEATAAAPCSASANAPGTQQTTTQPTTSAIVGRCVPSTMPYHLHPVFTGPKRVKRGKQYFLQRADAKFECEQKLVLRVQVSLTAVHALILILRSTGRSLPDGRLIVRPPSAQGESSDPVSRVYTGGDREASDCMRPFGDHVADSARRNNGQNTGEPSPAHVDGLLPDALVVPEVFAGADAVEDVQEVHQEEARRVGEKGLHEGDVGVHGAGADQQGSGAVWGGEVHDGHGEGFQVRTVHPHCSSSHDDARRLRCRQVSQESESVLLLHVRARGRGWRADTSPGQGPPGARARRGQQGAAEKRRDGQRDEDGREELPDQPALARADGGA
eukprot:6000975-Pleurochrysis_carterae.AAC.1